MNKKKWMTSLLALSLVSSFSTAPVLADGFHGKKHDNGNHYGWYKQQKVSFEDIDDGFSWAKQAIEKLAEEGIIRGMDDHHFQPAGKLNRAQFAVLVSRFFTLQASDTTHEDFLDVHNGDWYFKDVEAAKDYMTWFTVDGGYDFLPNQAINRAEAAVTLVQLLIKQNSIQLVSQDEANQILSVYEDANLIPQNLRIHVATAVKAGVIKGVAADRFDPLSTLNRAQAATLLYRLQTDVTNPSTGEPIEVVPGSAGSTNETTGTGTDTTSPTITYSSTSYTLAVGDSVSVSSNEMGAVYLIPATYTPAKVSDLDSLINSKLGVKAIVGQVNSGVSLDTSNLTNGDYILYAVDLSGNITKFSHNIQLGTATSIANVQTESKNTDSNGITHLTIGVQTTNITNNTQVNLELVNTNGTSLNPSITSQTVINNNTTTAILDIPATLQSGDYKVKVTIGNNTDQSLVFTK
ncbi:MAG TPA: S-layer homology domain-containing protein [Bacillota bacterium]|nr:S-layer homology domain-containing protein [Bacillota bacterium]